MIIPPFKLVELKVSGNSHSYFLDCVLSWLSGVPLFVTLWTVAGQAPLSVGFSRQDYWSGMPFPTPGDLPDPRIKPMSLAPPTLASGFFTTEPPGKPHFLNWKKPVCTLIDDGLKLTTPFAYLSSQQPCTVG